MTSEADAARALVAQRSDDPSAHYALAQSLDKAGDADGALASLRIAITLAPDYAEAHNLMGILYASAGEFNKAGGSFQQALQAKPGYGRAWNNLGNAFKSAGRLEEAEQAMMKAVEVQPDYQLGHHNLGVVRYGLGKSEEAVAALSVALELDMSFRPSWVMGAAAERQRGRLDEAAAALRQAIALAPAGSIDERIALAEVLSECGLHADALRTYDEARQAQPEPVATTLGYHLALPQVYPDAAALDEARARFASGLEHIERELDRLIAPLDAIGTLESFRWSNFLLAYQGRDDRALQERYAGIVARAVDAKAPALRAALPSRSARGQRLRVGFASAFFIDGTVGQYFRRWITGLDRATCEVFVYHVSTKHDALTDEIVAAADHVEFPLRTADPTIAAIAATIRDDDLDVLIYPELGMDARCMALGALRLARIQCAGWGHPVTTGHATIDYYFTAGAMEPEGADAQYTEKLVRLPGIGTSYRRPDFPVPAGAQEVHAARMQLRQRLRLAEDTPLFLCPQALFKILPDDDALFARVLDAVPRSALLLFEGRHRVATTMLMKRLGTALGRRGIVFRDRVRVLARVPRQDFLHINAACDAMLDTHRWSGGNSSLDAIAAGLPIVTLPGEQMRGRQTMAMLELLGVRDLIAADAEDYARIANRLATDPVWRAQIAAKIGASSHRIFDDAAPLVALSDFLLAVPRMP